MADLVPVSWIDLIKKLRNLGFEGPYQGGKHHFLQSFAKPGVLEYTCIGGFCSGNLVYSLIPQY